MTFNKTLIGALTLIAASNAHSSIVVDGNWTDWINPAGSGSAADWTPISSSTKYDVEDTAVGTSYLNPGYGGQAYDAEAIYVSTDSSNIYVAVITGRDPNAAGWRWGDIGIDFGLDGTFEYGIVTRGDSGEHSSSGIGDAGDVYSVSEWNLGIWDAPDVHNANPTTDYAKAHPTSIEAGTKIDDGDFAFSKVDFDIGGLGGDHWFMEARISVGSLDPNLLNQPFMAHWTMGCNNDWIQVDPLLGQVPEPTPFALLGLGLLGMFANKRKKQTS